MNSICANFYLRLVHLLNIWLKLRKIWFDIWPQEPQGKRVELSGCSNYVEILSSAAQLWCNTELFNGATLTN